MCGVDPEMKFAPHKEMAEFRVRGTGATDEASQVAIVPVGENERGRKSISIVSGFWGYNL